MGNAYSAFTREQLDEYEECTFFTRKEIIKLHRLFVDLTGGNKALSKLEFVHLPMLIHNPFKERIHNIFCTDEQNQTINFDDFLDFLSSFSPEASKDVKAFTAFKIFDYDDDGYIGRDDIRQVLRSTVSNELVEGEIELVINKIFEEVDIDGDEKISPVEFEQILSRSPDFTGY
ncbi:EF-hand [Rozella allomycis CSF55]|uniref:EF-hand n=1 Tax=Rozella allomycis (strain CSF55) TaxID=988480 RepID=A0A075ATH2_ROZAC|nr:EF-Hand 1, calcium-binding site domain-containing protein [Rozella allomycis CSF55]RKP18249.1 EF-hand [Rozella allomycis CSF55]|eukprot:EPZ31837.1 EF-Hand 1, calcium-binding site domain-containing protein [Rozella allomycis CSF55]